MEQLFEDRTGSGTHTIRFRCSFDSVVCRSALGHCSPTVYFGGNLVMASLCLLFTVLPGRDHSPVAAEEVMEREEA